MTTTITSDTIRKAAEKARERPGDTAGAVICAVEMLGIDTSGFGYIVDALADALDRVADAMDGMMPLPVGAYGEPLRPEEHVWGGDGREWVVTAIASDGYDVWIRELGKQQGAAKPARSGWFTHERPETWKRIISDAIDLGSWCPKNTGCKFDALVARCERLAGEGR
ncbi:hypothetical protein [Olsenella phocaeensis]|uniref:hypothetical protein n=1 Tax=Olsenella phocaeensis TaxID=1852385 RepID=UPI000930EC26|nr:hypothetical protein [Olsenella phocaeensis]